MIANTLFDDELEEPPANPTIPSGVPVLTFVVYGAPQQRGSKTAVPRGKKGGGIQKRKNGSPIIDMKDSNKNSKAYMTQVSLIAAMAFQKAGLRELLTDPIQLGVRFYFSRPRSHYGTGKNAKKLKPGAPTIHAQSPDLAKLIRCLEDALTGIVWLDDRLVFKYTDDTARYWTDGQERAEVSIYCHRQCG